MESTGDSSIASQSEWRRVRYLGESNNRLLVGRDPVADTSLNFDLSTLYVAQANPAWFIGFNANTDPIIDKTYVIYLDTDHVDGSGGMLPLTAGMLSRRYQHTNQNMFFTSIKSQDK